MKHTWPQSLKLAGAWYKLVEASHGDDPAAALAAVDALRVALDRFETRVRDDGCPHCQRPIVYASGVAQLCPCYAERLGIKLEGQARRTALATYQRLAVNPPHQIDEEA